MKIENDSNILYGGDLGEITETSLGQMILSDLEGGGNKTAIVSHRLA
jgi:hypothetical protein